MLCFTLTRYHFCAVMALLLVFLCLDVCDAVQSEHVIHVGRGGTPAFDPAITKAQVGDTVIFLFHPSNHSVVRGEYSRAPECGTTGCNNYVPYDMLYPDKQGFSSMNVGIQSVLIQNRVRCRKA